MIKSEPIDVDEPEYILDFDVEEPPELPIPSSAKKDSVCPHCTLIVRNEAELKLHVKAFHPSVTEIQVSTRNYSLVMDVEEEEENVDDPGYIIRPSSNYSSPAPLTSTNFSNSANNFYCSKCYFASNNQQVIQDHMIKNKHIEQFICNYCDKYFPFKHSLTKHHEICNKNNALCYTQYEASAMKAGSKYVCAKCLYLSETELDLNKHYFVTHKESSSQPIYFIQLAAALGRPEVNLHTSTATIIVDKDEKTPIKSGQPVLSPNVSMYFICIDCKTPFDKHTLFVEHRATEHKDKNIIKFIASRSKVGPWKNDDNFQRFCCLYCGTIYFDLVSLKTHFRVHKQFKIPFQYIFLTPKKGPKLMEEDTYKCTLCEAYPDGLKEIQMHWKKEHVNKIFKVIKLYSGNPFENYFCKLCDSKFCHQMMLEYHNMAKHSEEEGFKQNDIVAVTGKTPKANAHHLSLMSKTFDKSTSPKSKPPNHIGGKIADLYLRHVSKRYQCMFCLFSTDNFVDLKYHHQKKHEDFVWQYIYVRKSSTGSLKMICSIEKVFQCFYCNYEFDKKDEKAVAHFSEHKKEPVKYKVYSSLDGYINWKNDDDTSDETEEKDIKPDINLLNKNLNKDMEITPDIEVEQIVPDAEEILSNPYADEIDLFLDKEDTSDVWIPSNKSSNKGKKRKKNSGGNGPIMVNYFDGTAWQVDPYDSYAKNVDLNPKVVLMETPNISNSFDNIYL